MRLTRHIVRILIGSAVLASVAGVPAMAADVDEVFFAYGCGVIICSHSFEHIPASGITRQRFILSDRYASDVSITLTPLKGKTLVVMNRVTIPFGGNVRERHYAFEIPTGHGPSTMWLDTDTDGEYDILLVNGREALADAPYPHGPVKHIGSPVFIAN